MKATLRIPTKQQYAYIEVEVEGTPEEIKDKYDEMTTLINSPSGQNHANDLDFADYLITLMDSDLKEWGGVEYYECLPQHQKNIMQSIKRFYKRLPK